MYSLQLLKAPARCANCGTFVTSRLAGHHFRKPMCHSCFHQADPELAEALGLRPISVQLLKKRSGATCVNCGDSLSGQRFAGFHLGDQLCTPCFLEHGRELAALLMMEAAVLRAADGRRDAAGLMKVAISYALRLYRLDAEHPREPIEPDDEEPEEPDEE